MVTIRVVPQSDEYTEVTYTFDEWMAKEKRFSYFRDLKLIVTGVMPANCDGLFRDDTIKDVFSDDRAYSQFHKIEIDVTNADFSNVLSAKKMFYGLNPVTIVGDFSLPLVKDISYFAPTTMLIFKSDTSLSMPNVEDATYAFHTSDLRFTNVTTNPIALKKLKYANSMFAKVNVQEIFNRFQFRDLEMVDYMFYESRLPNDTTTSGWDVSCDYFRATFMRATGYDTFDGHCFKRATSLRYTFYGTLNQNTTYRETYDLTHCDNEVSLFETFRGNSTVSEVHFKNFKVLKDPFKNCGNLKLVTSLRGDNVFVIDNSASLPSCSLEHTNLKSIEIISDKSVLITEKAFNSCVDLETFKLAAPSCAFYGSSAFAYCLQLRTIDIPKVVKPYNKNGYQVFYNCNELESIDTSLFASNITKNMFYGCKKLKTVSLKNMKNIEEAQWMFMDSGVTTITHVAPQNNKELTNEIRRHNLVVQTNLTEDDLVRIENGEAFPFELNFKVKTIDGHKTWNLKEWQAQPKDSVAFNIIVSGEFPSDSSMLFAGFKHNITFASDIDTSNVTNFTKCFKDTEGKFFGLSRFDMSNVVDCREMFRNNSSFNSNEIADWDMSEVKYTGYMFFRCTNFNVDVSSWNTLSLKDPRFMFGHCTAFNRNLEKWSMGKVWMAQGIFAYCTSYNQPISKWDLKSCRYTTSLFLWCENYNHPVNCVNTDRIENISYMFRGCKKLTSIGSFNPINVRDFRGIFWDCDAYGVIDNLDHWNVEKIVSMRNVFYNTSLKRAPKWDLINCKDMSYAFAKCSQLDGDSVKNVKVYNKCTSYTACFAYLDSKSLALDWEVDENANVLNMFSDSKINRFSFIKGQTNDTLGLAVRSSSLCKYPRSGPVVNGSDWYRISHGEDFPFPIRDEYFIVNLTNGTHWNMTEWNSTYPTSRPQITGDLMVIGELKGSEGVGLFSGASNIQSVTFSPQLHTDRLASVNAMFNGCTNLINIDIESLNIGIPNGTDNRVYTGNMFLGCDNVHTIKFGYFKAIDDATHPLPSTTQFIEFKPMQDQGNLKRGAFPTLSKPDSLDWSIIEALKTGYPFIGFDRVLYLYKDTAVDKYVIPLYSIKPTGESIELANKDGWKFWMDIDLIDATSSNYIKLDNTRKIDIIKHR